MSKKVKRSSIRWFDVEVTHYFQGGEREPDNWSVQVQARNKTQAKQRARQLVLKMTTFTVKSE